MTAADGLGNTGHESVEFWIVPFPADLDGDGDVDLSDFGIFQSCFNGPNRSYAAGGCADADLDGDFDVDLSDFGMFQACFNGPNRPPACAD